MAARAPGGRGLAGWAQVGAGLTSPSRAVRCSQTPLVRLSDSFIFFLCAALSSAVFPYALLYAAAKLCLFVAHNPCSALESAPQGSAPILFDSFPPVFPPFYSHSFHSGPPRLLSLFHAIRFCMRLCIRITSCLFQYLFVSVLHYGDVAEGGVRS